MRISDWSPDVCSSDLTPSWRRPAQSGRMPEVNILTLNSHMGFNLFNRRFVLPELREAIRAVAADVVFLQEVMGENALHAKRLADWPAASQYEFLADTTWAQHAYGRNAARSEEHTSELQSLMRISYAVFCLKKKKTN